MSTSLDNAEHGADATCRAAWTGRLWKLIRTNWKVFWQAFSEDGGLSWQTIGPSAIDASSAPGLLTRLESGRLLLVWNRYFPEGKNDFPLSGGDNQWSEVPVSNHRLELSIMFSEDDGKTWSAPAVIARIKKGSLAYPYVFEARAGELWITTMQGGLRVKLHERDFVGG
ncbi:MAG: exo-alpha-sialidase [Planctomycetota bacterium]